MNSFQIYNDLIIDIEILQDQLERTDRERSQWWIGGRLFTTVPMDNAATRVDNLIEKMERIEEALRIKKEAKERIVTQLRRYDGLEYKVFYMRYVQCKTLREIADELGYSYDYIREISSRIKDKEPTMHPQTS